MLGHWSDAGLHLPILHKVTVLIEFNRTVSDSTKGNTITMMMILNTTQSTPFGIKATANALVRNPLPELRHQLLSEVLWEAHRGTSLG